MWGEMSEKNRRWDFVNRPAFLSILGFTVIAAVFVWLLIGQTRATNYELKNTAIDKIFITEVTEDGKVTSSKAFDAGIDSERAALMAMEHDVVVFRYKLFQSAVISRLFLQTLALMAGLAMIIMGSSFIFARIEVPEIKAGLDAQAGSDTSFKAAISTTAPGLVLASIGALTIIATTLSAGLTSIKTVDHPIYLSGSNGSDWKPSNSEALAKMDKVAAKAKAERLRKSAAGGE